MTEHPELCVTDAAAWRAWLDANEDASDGVWLVLAKKGTTDPTSLRYDEALDEALCSGWIDGQKRSRDATTFLQRFTPRRARSMWSLRNTEHIARLEADGRMRPRGRTEVDKAQGRRPLGKGLPRLGRRGGPGRPSKGARGRPGKAGPLRGAHQGAAVQRPPPADVGGNAGDKGKKAGEGAEGLDEKRESANLDQPRSARSRTE